MAAFGKAVLVQPRDASSHYGLGYAIRTFAQKIKDEGTRHAELQRAVASLKEAHNLRPGYYEAHRELAFCYHLLDNLPAARREYELANAHRGAATDENEVAAPSGAPKLKTGRTPGVEGTDPLAEAGRKILRFHFARMLDREDGTRSGEDIEDLHRMRVATRRMRAAWRLFGDAYRHKAERRYVRELRAVAASLGG